jgi:hypothetical protein
MTRHPRILRMLPQSILRAGNGLSKGLPDRDHTGPDTAGDLATILILALIRHTCIFKKKNPSFRVPGVAWVLGTARDL